MSDNRGPNWLDEATAELLLRGTTDAVTGRDGRAAALAELIAAASAPAALDPKREEEALAAFRVARAEGALTEGVRRRRRQADDWRPRRLRHAARSAKAVTGALLATVTLGGVAVAAAVGALPTSIGNAVPGTSVRGGGPGTGDTTLPPTSSASADRERLAGGASPGGATGATPSTPATSMDYKALCEAYVAAGRQATGMDAQAYQRLKDAAGGRKQLRGYCAALLGDGGDADSSGASGGNDGSADTGSSASKDKPHDGSGSSSATDSSSGPDVSSKNASQ